MKIIRVKNKTREKQFHQVAHEIYKNDPNWISPIHADIDSIFNKEGNDMFKHSPAVRFILIDANGALLGRVAVFINHKAISNMEYPIGGIGFFECIDNQEAAFKLFDSCKEWLMRRDMVGMDGPINFGERDKFWGLLVDGFTPPSYMENYNPPYYKAFFENYGFRLYFEQFTYLIQRENFDPARLEAIATRVIRKPEYTFLHFKQDQMEKFAKDFVEIYNAAWQRFDNFKPVSKHEILNIFKDLKPIVVPEFIWFAYSNGKPAAFVIMMPDVNQLFKHVNGKLNLIGKLKFLFYKRTRPMNKLKGLVFGIHPDYQNLGLDAALMHFLYEEVTKTDQYTEVVISWIGGFNPKMHSLMKALNAEVAKVHNTYRKLFYDDLPFEPFKLNN